MWKEREKNTKDISFDRAFQAVQNGLFIIIFFRFSFILRKIEIKVDQFLLNFDKIEFLWICWMFTNVNILFLFKTSLKKDSQLSMWENSSKTTNH